MGERSWNQPNWVPQLLWIRCKCPRCNSLGTAMTLAVMGYHFQVMTDRLTGVVGSVKLSTGSGGSSCVNQPDASSNAITGGGLFGQLRHEWRNVGERAAGLASATSAAFTIMRYERFRSAISSIEGHDYD
jgi:hypothetical protein